MPRLTENGSTRVNVSATVGQREAILHDEENALVVAGAGTGKTSTIVGKVGYR